MGEGWAENSNRCASSGSGDLESPAWGCKGNELVNDSYGRAEVLSAMFELGE